MTTTPEIDYWHMTDSDLRSAWDEVTTDNEASDFDGSVTERLLFIEDAILQRIGAPDDADGDDPEWQERIRAWSITRA